MKKNKIPLIIGASSLALILLFAIQVKWMDQSRRLIEEQFDQKVSMALCRAVDDVVKTDGGKEVVLNCNGSPTENCVSCNENISTFITSLNIKDQVTKALTYYQIDMPFQLWVEKTSREIQQANCNPSFSKDYSCSLDPILDNDDMELSINFIGKTAYVRKEMGLMLTLSILMMLFITGVFIYANYYLLQQKKLSERNKEFFNHMAHEFKTPLTNIGLASKMLMKRDDDPLVNIIHTENKQLTNQVGSVLSMAALESGQFEIKKEIVNLKDLITRVAESMRIQLDGKKGALTVSGIDPAMTIYADPHHLSNAFKNILENAIKYNDRIPQINIKGESKGSKIRLSFQDNGVGITPENQQLIFEKFYRIQESENYQSKGFGLGLSYVKKIVNLHNGEITIFSEWKKGTRFDLQFPKAL